MHTITFYFTDNSNPLVFYGDGKRIVEVYRKLTEIYDVAGSWGTPDGAFSYVLLTL